MSMKAYWMSKKRQQRDIACLGANNDENKASQSACDAPINLKTGAENKQCNSKVEGKSGRNGSQALVETVKEKVVKPPVAETQPDDKKDDANNKNAESGFDAPS